MLYGRELLRNLDEKRGLNLARLSLQIGKNRTYLHGYLTRESPRQLPEDIREKLAPLLGVSPDELREPDDPKANLASRNLSPISYVKKHDAEVMADVIQALAEGLNFKGDVSQVDFAKMCASFYGLAMKKIADGTASKDAMPTPSELEALIQFTNLKR